MDKEMKEMLERVGKKFLDSFDTSRDGHIANVELANYQLYLVAGEERTPIKVVWLFSHINEFEIDLSNLSVNTDSIFKALFEIFKVDHEDMMIVNHRRMLDEIFTFNIENKDGRRNRKFTKEIRKYMGQRSRKYTIDTTRLIIEKAITTEAIENGFVFKMKDNTEITLMVPEVFKTTESILEHIQDFEADFTGFELSVRRFSIFGSDMKSRTILSLRPDNW